MDSEKRLELVKNNTEELITEEELKQLLETKDKPVTYCGYEPSGPVHLGHLVTITKLTELKKAGFHVKVLFADWHAWLNKKGDWNFIEKQLKTWEKAFKATGLEDAEYVKGTDFQRAKEYIDDLFIISINTTLNRGLRSMQEVARDIEHASVSQVIYPLMQINDIKHLGVDVAQAGIEQRKIHMLAREVLHKVDYQKPMFVHTPLINSLSGPGKKMSSSLPESIISVNDSEADIKAKINKSYCVEGEVEGNPVLEISRLIVFPRIKELKIERPDKFGGDIGFPSYEDLEKAFAAKELHPMDLKNAVTSQLIEILEPARKAFSK